MCENQTHAVQHTTSAVPALTIGSTLVGCVKDKPASPRAQRIYFAFNSRSKMLFSASTAARHSGRSHAGFLGCSQQWSLRTAFNILRVMAVGRQSALSKM